ncbi:MAG TPA: hypothetical protein VF679_03390, partial [Pedobacter sp.]
KQILTNRIHESIIRLNFIYFRYRKWNSFFNGANANILTLILGKSGNKIIDLLKRSINKPSPGEPILT